MAEPARLAIGDEILCKRCGQWRRIEQTAPDDRLPDVRVMLWFRCPRVNGPFYAGRIGEPPHDETRWRRG